LAGFQVIILWPLLGDHRGITSSLRDVLGSLAGTGASATPASLTGSASGSVNYLINLVDAGQPR